MIKRNGHEQLRKPATMAALENLYFTDSKAAQLAFNGIFNEHARNWAVVKAGQGIPSQRGADLSDSADIEYTDYSPPALWQPPHAILLGTFAKRKKKKDTKCVWHGGEEIAIPIDHELCYMTYYSKGGRSPQIDYAENIRKGEIFRLNPRVPHYAWGQDDNAKAWMVFWHPSDTEAAISVDRDIGVVEGATSRATEKANSIDEFKKPGRYALVAWGLAQKLRDQRDRAGLRINQVAAACGTDHAHLSRIESGKANVSLAMLMQLATFLKVDIGESFLSEPWEHAYIRQTLPEHSDTHERKTLVPLPADSTHFLHIASIVLRGDRGAKSGNVYPKAINMPYGTITSYIVLSGRVIAEFQGRTASDNTDNDGAKETTSDLLSPGTVLHLRRKQQVTLQALDDTRLLEIVYSGLCTCDHDQKSRA